MTWLLDSNVCIGYMRGRSVRIRQRLAAAPASDVFLCSPVRAELEYGALCSNDPAANLLRVATFSKPFASLSFDDAAAEQFARFRRHLESQGMMIGPYDLQIASIAVANGCTLVSHNTREFSRVPALNLEDWEL